MRPVNENQLFDLADLFKMFSDTSRLKILYCLSQGPKAVNEIAKESDLTLSAASHQLRILKTAKLITSRKDGKQVFYSLADDHVQTIIDMGIEHVME